MSDTNIAPPQPIGRVVVELSADGRIYMERYVNGARSRNLLDRGNEWWEIRDALSDQLKRNEDTIAKKHEQAENNRLSRHNRIWADAARKHGTAFANRAIGPFREYENDTALPSGPANPDREHKPGITEIAISEMIRVCHCGRIVEPFMEKCEGCPGHFGAGKIPRPMPRDKVTAKAKEQPTLKQMLDLL